MPNYYTVVQYVPDPVTDERINVGVIAFGEGEEVTVRFISRWSRAESFGDESLSFLQEFARRLEKSAAISQLEIPGMEQTIPLNAEAVRMWSGKWLNSIQLTEPRASLENLDELISQMSQRMLREPQRATRGYRDRRAAVKVARTHLSEQLTTKLGADGAQHWLHDDVPIEGRHDDHRFPIALSNGENRLAVKALSFEGRTTTRRRNEVDAVAWTIDDVRKKHPNLRLAVVTLPPKSKTDFYEHHKRVFESLRAKVIEESDVPDWSEKVVNNLVSAI